MMFRRQVEKVETTGERVISALNTGTVIACVALMVSVVALVVAVKGNGS